MLEVQLMADSHSGKRAGTQELDFLRRTPNKLACGSLPSKSGSLRCSAASVDDLSAEALKQQTLISILVGIHHAGATTDNIACRPTGRLRQAENVFFANKGLCRILSFVSSS